MHNAWSKHQKNEWFLEVTAVAVFFMCYTYVVYSLDEFLWAAVHPAQRTISWFALSAK